MHIIICTVYMHLETKGRRRHAAPPRPGPSSHCIIPGRAPTQRVFLHHVPGSIRGDAVCARLRGSGGSALPLAEMESGRGLVLPEMPAGVQSALGCARNLGLGAD